MARSDNRSLIPDDFMFELSPAELNNLRSQFSSTSWGEPDMSLWLLWNIELLC